MNGLSRIKVAFVRLEGTSPDKLRRVIERALEDAALRRGAKEMANALAADGAVEEPADLKSNRAVQLPGGRMSLDRPGGSARARSSTTHLTPEWQHRTLVRS